ncbi:hypothetical protein ACFFV7_09385 [Nonomuraea spiralis]|uniref:Secreted protein n=1 Tax=Nonomuraea spiralis TaxID=46182 RepID=A0ABV5IA68_9ACTN|nr:hypothetical protein [Nonomuraea spiralis]GGT05460.1 hypothetical protein GCM10010176_057070 [Nonomuraea spiralis]
MTRRVFIPLGAAVLALGCLGAPSGATAQSASCWGGPTVTIPNGKTYSTKVCPTWTQTRVRELPATNGETTGYLFPANNWVVCQRSGGENDQLGGGRNNIWLYTEGDTTQNEYNGWGWIPATSVSYGGDYQAIPGVPWCTGTNPRFP